MNLLRSFRRPYGGGCRSSIVLGGRSSRGRGCAEQLVLRPIARCRCWQAGFRERWLSVRIHRWWKVLEVTDRVVIDAVIRNVRIKQ